MNVKFPTQIPWLPLLLLWLAYVLLGWYLAFHHIFLLIGAFGVALSLVLVWKSTPWLERFFDCGYQDLLAIVR